MFPLYTLRAIVSLSIDQLALRTKSRFLIAFLLDYPTGPAAHFFVVKTLAGWGKRQCQAGGSTDDYTDHCFEPAVWRGINYNH
jgi:hypothetical protein